MMTCRKRCSLTVLACAFTLLATAQSAEHKKPRQWSLQATWSKTTLEDDSPAGQSISVGDDEGEAYTLMGDYYLNKHIALTAGLAYGREGLLTNLGSGLGLKKSHRLDIIGGAKLYPLPNKWLVQPFIGGNVMVNPFSFWGQSGSKTYSVFHENHWRKLNVDYALRNPTLQFAPRVGFDLYLFTSVALTMDWDMRWALGGYHRADLRFIDGPYMGQLLHYDTATPRTAFSVGLKVDFPAKPVSEQTTNTLWGAILTVLGLWFTATDTSTPYSR